MLTKADEGGEGVSQKLTIADEGGGGVSQKLTIADDLLNLRKPNQTRV